jgi:multiple sugar transport system permease protein
MKNIKLRKNKFLAQFNRNRSFTGYLFILPSFIGFLIFSLIPVIFAISVSFTKWNSIQTPIFIGFKNFFMMFRDSSFIVTLTNTLLFTFGALPFTIAIALIFAVMLNEGIKGKSVFRAMFFFPNIASVVAIAITWQLLFHPGAGPVNSFLMSLGMESPPRWLSSRDTAMFSVIMVYVWMKSGYYMVMFLAGLQTIPESLYESALMDGANPVQRFLKITIPMLSPTFFLVIIFFIIDSFKVFSLIYVMTDGGPGRATSVLVYYVFDQAFRQSKFGYASAMSIVLFVILLIITVIQYRGQKKWVTYIE